MPYINQEARERLDKKNRSPDDYPNNSGELNYKITQLLIEYLNKKDLSYKTINDIVGAIESSKQEFYRRVVIPYEDAKIKQNGDVY